MPSNMKLKEMIRIRNLIIICLISIFIWWGGNSILKYWSQPLTTDTSYVLGDSINGIKFPVITICQTDFYARNPLLKDCIPKSWNLINSFIHCMKKDKNFLIESFMDSLQLDIRKIVAMVRLWTGSPGHRW